MIPIPDLVALAEARIAKMVLAGDTGQLQAVKNGGSPCSTSPSPDPVYEHMAARRAGVGVHQHAGLALKSLRSPAGVQRHCSDQCSDRCSAGCHPEA